MNKDLIILKEYLNDYEYGINLDDSDVIGMFLMFRICEKIIQISKKFEVNQDLIRITKKHRNFIAHKDFIRDFKNLKHTEKEIYGSLLKMDLNDLFLNPLDEDFRIYTNEEILSILIDNGIDIDKHNIFRLKNIPDILSVKKELNYMIFENLNEEDLENIRSILSRNTKGAVNIRTIRKLENTTLIPENKVIWTI